MGFNRGVPNLQDLILRVAKDYPSSISLSSNETELSYKELVEEAHKIADRLKFPAHIGLCCRDPLTFAKAYLGILLMGGIVVPIPYRSTVREIKHYIVRTDCSTLLTDREDLIEGNFFSIQTINPCSTDWIVQPPTFGCLRDGTAVLLQTSGSVNKPKVVQLTHSGLIWNASSHNDFLKLHQKNNTLIILPLSSSFAHTTQFLAQMINGGTSFVTTKPFFPLDVYRLIKRNNIFSLGCTSFHLRLFAKYPPESEVIDTLKIVVCAGGPTPMRDIETVNTYFPNTKFLRAYGLTEAGPRVTCTSPEYKIQNESSGLPLPGVHIKIDQGLKPCVEEELGEILVKSPGIMKGYYKNHIETQNTIIDGWLKTGDIGYLDKSNNLFIIGRKKTAIIVGGNNIYPEEIEEFLVQLPGVLDAAVYGEEHTYLGEQIVALIIPSTTQVKIEEIMAECQRNLNSHKNPKKYYIVSTIPRSENGKIQRSKLGALRE